MEHKTGYYVWVYGDKYWHRTFEGAMARAVEADAYCNEVQIIDAETGEQVADYPGEGAKRG